MRDHEKTLGLSSSGEFARFITEDFAFYGHWHTRLRQAAKTVTEGLEAIHYCAQNNFRLLCSLMLGVTNKQLYYAIVQWVEENQ